MLVQLLNLNCHENSSSGNPCNTHWRTRRC